MPIKGATILTTPTITATGGTPSTLTETSLSIKNGVQVSDVSVADFRVRPTLTLKTRPPALQNDGSWSKGKTDFTLVIPLLRANGTTSFPLTRGEIETDVEMTDAQVTKLMQWTAQIWFDSDFTTALKGGGLS